MPIFFTKKSCNRGGGTTPQMPLTVKAYVSNLFKVLKVSKKDRNMYFMNGFIA